MDRRTCRTVVLLCLFMLCLVPTAAQGPLAPPEIPQFAPSNDNFTNRRGISWTMTHVVEIQEATVEANEPVQSCFGVVAEDSVWYEFAVPAGTITLSTHNSTGAALDTVMTLWTGTEITGLSEVECDDDDGVGDLSYISRSLSAGTYVLQVARASTLGSIVPGTLNVNMHFVPSGTVPSNDLIANAIPLALPSMTMVADIVNANYTASEPTSSCSDFNRPHTIWYTFTLTEAAVVSFSSNEVLGTGNRIFSLLQNPAPGTYTQMGCSGALDDPFLFTLPAGVYFVGLATSNYNGATDLDVFTLNLGIDPVLNGGFETGMQTWKVGNKTGDKRKCDTDEVEVAYYGKCVFVFKGGPGEKSTLSQTLPLPADFTATDNMVVTPAFRHSSKPGTKLKLVVTMVTPSGKVKCDLPQVEPIEGYWMISQTACPMADGATKLKAKFVHTSSKGKVLLDQVSVAIEVEVVSERTVVPAGVLPPPEAPAGFRGSN